MTVASVVLAWLRLRPCGGRRCSVEVATATEWSALYELAAWGAVPVNPGRRSVPGEGEVLGEGERPLGQDS